MEFKIKKEIEKVVKIDPPYFCRDMNSYYKVTEDGMLINVFARGIVVQDLNSPLLPASLMRPIVEGEPCSREEFEKALAETTQKISTAMKSDMFALLTEDNA